MTHARTASPTGTATLSDESIVALGDGRALWFDGMLGSAVASAVRAEALRMVGAGQLRQAGMGRRADVVTQTRGDMIAWLDPDAIPPVFAPVLELFVALMQTLNELAFLGARSLETQLAVYAEGGAYARHRDALARSSSRRATAIYYANPWIPGDGGELELFEVDGIRLLEPIADRMVVFRSDTVEHAVREVHRGPRVAITSWLRAG